MMYVLIAALASRSELFGHSDDLCVRRGRLEDRAAGFLIQVVSVLDLAQGLETQLVKDPGRKVAGRLRGEELESLTLEQFLDLRGQGRSQAGVPDLGVGAEDEELGVLLDLVAVEEVEPRGQSIEELQDLGETLRAPLVAGQTLGLLHLRLVRILC